MARLPYNIERVKTPSGYCHRGYTKDGRTVALDKDSGRWRGTVTMTREHVGYADTLEAMGKLLSVYASKEF